LVAGFGFVGDERDGPSQPIEESSFSEEAHRHYARVYRAQLSRLSDAELARKHRIFKGVYGDRRRLFAEGSTPGH
jgi:hypothetical protein